MKTRHDFKLLALLAFAYAVAFAAPAQAAGNQRPLSDWLDRQGDQNLFFPPVPDLLGWVNGNDPPRQPTRFVLVDYAGKFAEYIKNASGFDLGTTVSGQVTERPLADGRALVHVTLHASSALATVWDCSDCANVFPGPVLFGSSAYDVAHNGATPALGEADLNVKFINSAPGAPLPSLVAAMGNYGPPPPDVEVLDIRFSARATGALHGEFGVPEGTPGQLMVSQTGFKPATCSKQVGPKDGDGIRDCYPVETVFLRAIGR